MIEVKIYDKKSNLYAQGTITEGYNGGNWTADIYLIGDESPSVNLIRRPDRISIETAIRERYQSYRCEFKYKLG